MTGGHRAHRLAHVGGFLHAVKRALFKPLAVPVMMFSLAVLLPAALLLMSVWLNGWQLQVVRSDSMAPTYWRGTMLVTEPAVAADVRPGDALMFTAPWLNRRIVTHRVRTVVESPDGSRSFVTRGDANDADDPSPVPAREVRGVVRWGVPKLGTALWTIRGQRGLIVLVVIPAIALVASESWTWRRRRRRPPCEVCGFA